MASYGAHDAPPLAPPIEGNRANRRSLELRFTARFLPEATGGVVTIDVLDDAATEPERILTTDLDREDTPSMLRDTVRQMQHGGQATPIFALSAIVKDCASLADARAKCAALTARPA